MNNKVTFSWFCLSDRNSNITEIEEILSTAKTAEKSGFSSILIPTDSNCLDPWTVSTYILQNTDIIKPIIALRTGFIEPVYASRMISTIIKIYGDRLQLNIVSGSSKKELLKEGNYLTHQNRYQRTDEFIEILIGLLENRVINFSGKFYSCKNAQLYPPIEKSQLPTIYLAGSSHNAMNICEKFKLNYLFFADDLTSTKEKLNNGILQDIKKSMRVNIILRDSKEEAIRTAELTNIKTENHKKIVELIHRSTESIGQKRIAELSLESDIHDTCLWTGFVGGRTGSVPTLVGNENEIYDALIKYVNLGITHFIISSIQNEEEIRNIGGEIISKFFEKEVKKC